MDVPLKSNGEINFQNLESLARSYICCNPEENIFELTASNNERKEILEYFNNGDFNIKYKRNGGKKYEMQISANI